MGNGCMEGAEHRGAPAPLPPTEEPRHVPAPPGTPCRACAQPTAGGGRPRPTWRVTFSFLCLRHAAGVRLISTMRLKSIQDYLHHFIANV